MQRLIVHCDSWCEFAQLYATDVSQGGMFIATDEAPEILTDVSIELKLPEGHDIALKASVVHVLDPEQAARENRSAGIGVQFIDLDPLRKRQIQQLVEFARWEGASNNPSATYASRLFEISASLPPSKVLEALPPAQPEAAGRAVSGDVSRHARRARTRSSDGIPDPTESSRRTDEQPLATPAPPKPTDPAQVKLGLSLLAHKEFTEAIGTFEEILKGNPGDLQVQAWLHIAKARLRLKDSDEAGALAHFRQVLAVDEDNREARKFVREYSAKKRLNALPFGRYFVKKS